MKILEIKQEIQKNIDHEQNVINVYNHLITVLKPFEDKRVTQRMATAVEKNLPSGYERAYLTTMAGMTHLVVVPKIYDNNIRFLLCYNDNPIFKIGIYNERHSGFACFNNCYGQAAEDRNVERRIMLSKAIKLAGIANTFAKAVKAVRNAESELNDIAHFSVQYEMTKILKMKIEN